MSRLIFGVAAILAVLSSNSVVLSDPSPPRIQFPQVTFPANPLEIDEHSRAQARSVLDDMLSQYPTLVDAVAGLLKTQELLLSANPLQTISIPQQPAFELPDLSRGLPGLPGLPGLSGDALMPSLASTTLSNMIDGFLGNLRSVAASPMQLAPIRLVPPGGTPVVSPMAGNNLGIDTRSLIPGLPELPRFMVPFIVNLPNDQGLPANEVVENFKQKVRDQMPPGSDGSLQAEVTLDPSLSVIDAKPVTSSGLPLNPDGSKKEPYRATVPGGLLGGNTDVQIYLRNALEQQAENIRKAVTDTQRNIPQVSTSWY